MTTYTEKTLASLLEGAADVDGDAISVRRINGSTPTSWPHPVTLTTGAVLVAQNGEVTFDDGGDTSEHPTSGSLANGTFNFTLWDNKDESGAYTASIALEAAGFTATAPAQPSSVMISGETSVSFDITLPADPDDGGDAITKRVVSIMPEDDYNSGNYSNASYLNDFSAQETRTINANNYSAIGSDQTHVVRWKSVNSTADNGGHGPYSNPEVATLLVGANAPTFTSQPSLGGSSFTAGATLTLALGTGTGDNAVTASIEYFRLGSTSKIGELSGLNWSSAGEMAGTLYFRTRLTDNVTGTFTLSNEITAALTVSNGTSAVKDQVLALFGTSGRNSVAAIQNLNSGTAPAGVNFGQTGAGAPSATLSQQGITLENYAINNLTILWNADNCTMRQCTMAEGNILHPLTGAVRLVDIKANVKNILIEDCSFEGTKAYGPGVGSAVFQRPLTSTAAGTGGIVRRCRFKWFGQDVIKTAGGLDVEECVFYALSNVDAWPDFSKHPQGRWTSTNTYSAGELVRSTTNNKHYRSRVNNNRGNALTNNTFWEYKDPHCDVWNPRENKIPMTFRRNLILQDGQDPMIPAADRAYSIGNNSAVQAIRNQSTNNTTQYEVVYITENVFRSRNQYLSNPPLSINSVGGNWTNPVVDGNYIDAASNGLYAIGSAAGSTTWGINYDATTGATISP